MSPLIAAFVANNESNDLLVAASPDGQRWSGNAPTGQQSKTAPALAAFGGPLGRA